jgi:hypothetical protein
MRLFLSVQKREKYMLRVDFIEGDSAKERGKDSKDFMDVLTRENVSFFGNGSTIKFPSLTQKEELPREAQEFLSKLPQERYRFFDGKPVTGEDSTQKIEMSPQPEEKIAGGVKKKTSDAFQKSLIESLGRKRK